MGSSLERRVLRILSIRPAGTPVATGTCERPLLRTIRQGRRACPQKRRRPRATLPKTTAILQGVYDSVIYPLPSKSFLPERVWENPAFLQKSGFSRSPSSLPFLAGSPTRGVSGPLLAHRSSCCLGSSFTDAPLDYRDSTQTEKDRRRNAGNKERPR
jgi:hypothetical protein